MIERYSDSPFQNLEHPHRRTQQLRTHPRAESSEHNCL